jgi:(E)-4-hydroxy-3-methylbut-2-enyl-diphosphate synthase
MENPAALYCNSLTSHKRLLTRVVNVGNVPLGGDNPIRVQSMTTTDTMDTLATVEQSIRMINAGCEYVRITAPSINEARNLENIRKELHSRGYFTPLVADIHFTPNAAEHAARIVEKVRVNPGNYADKKKFETHDYTDAGYEAELDRIRQRFTPLVIICKEYGTAMRIGTNHGSLSDRIMSRYGDSPLGMVESALEFLKICEDNNYHNIVLSMKSSNPQVMVQAYRLLITRMQATGIAYPLHLGVTEAGEGEDGRIKSAAGIGTLLEDGIGDTIRVSLTEDPEFEIPVAKALVNKYQNRSIHSTIPGVVKLPYSPFSYSRRHTDPILNTGGANVPVVIADYSHKNKITPASLFAVGYNYSSALDKWNLTDQACDYIFCGNTTVTFEIPGTLGLIYDYDAWLSLEDKTRCYPFIEGSNYVSTKEIPGVLKFVSVDLPFILLRKENFLNKLRADANVVLVLTTENDHGMAEQRRALIELMNVGIKTPVIIRRNYKNLTEDILQLHAATDIGALLLDGMGDGLWISCETVSEKSINSLSFGILQATRTRISKTEYISCPSCGRTLFDLQETTARIRSRTNHLKGIKIGIMGCIVNGPGEMADADYGYVGVGPGKITLYKGREVVRKNIEALQAVDELIDLIKINGDWVEPAAVLNVNN